MTGDQGAPILAIVIPLIVAVGLYVWTAFALTRVFPRLGIPAWQAWVPVLNLAAIFTKAGIPAWQVVLLFVPIANLYGIYQLVIAFHRINLAFGKGPGMTALAVLLLPVWATIIGSEAAAPQAGAAQEDPVSDPQFPSVQPAVPPQQPAPPAVAPPDAAPAEPDEVAAAEPAPAEPAPVEPPVATAAVPPPAEPPQPVGAPRASTFAPPANASSQPAAPVVAPVIAPPPGAAVVPPVAPPVEPVDRSQVVLEEPIGTPEPIVAPEPVVPEPVIPAAFVSEPVVPETGDAVVPELADAEPAVPEPSEDEEEDRTVVVEDDVPEEEDEEEDRTVVVDRRPAIVWELVTEDGERLPLTSASVVLGRRPGPVQGSTVIAVPDATKTLSKVHARLDLVDDVWTITDLESTNGIFIVEADGTERELDRSGSSPVTGSFVLGKVVLAIERVGDAG